jgi:Bacterial TniB protein
VTAQESALAPPGDAVPGTPSSHQPTTLAGWRAFVADAPSIPVLLDQDALAGLTPAGRLTYDDLRLAHHARLLVVATPTIRQVALEGRRLQYLNRHADAGRCGLILSGPARTGKTTCLMQLGKTIEVIHRQRHPQAGGHIPVIYITVPPAATPKMIAFEFARFLGIPLTRRSNITDVLEAVCGVCLNASTTLICVDEIHNLNLGTRHGAEASDTLKYFAERLPATFVYAGIDVERAGLLSGPRGEQIAGRFSMIRTGAFGRGEQWKGLIATLEDSLRLHAHRPGALVTLAAYLHDRSNGMIGSLLRLIRLAAIGAVLDGSEAITRTTLESIPVDIASESGHRR